VIDFENTAEGWVVFGIGLAVFAVVERPLPGFTYLYVGSFALAISSLLKRADW
jgi:hypothetical protein